MSSFDYLYMVMFYENDKWFPVNVFSTWEDACGERHDWVQDVPNEAELHRVRCYKKDNEGSVYVVIDDKPNEVFYDEDSALHYVKDFNLKASIVRYSPI